MTILTRLPLRRRIMVLVAAGLGLTLVAVAVAGIEVIAQSTTRVLQERLVLARVSAANLNDRLAASLSRLGAISATFRLPSVRVLPPDVLRTLALAASRPGLFTGGFLVMDPAQRVVWPLRLGGTVFDEPALRRALRGTSAISGLVRLLPHAEPAAVAWVPLRAPSGSTVGALGGVIDLRSSVLVDLIQPLAIGRTGHAVIVDADGIVLAGTEREERFTRGDHPDFFANLIRLKKADVGRTPEIIDGIPREDHVMAFAPLAITQWGLGFGQAEWEVFLYERNLRRRLLELGLLLMVAGLVVTWWDAGIIATPLRRLTASARRIAEGDLTSPIPAEHGFEVGELAHTLETMRSNLAHTRAELESRTVAVERQSDQTRALYEVSRAILSDAHLSDVLATVASSARSLLGAEASAVCLWDADGRRVIPGAFDGHTQAFQGSGGAAACEQIALGDGWPPAANCPFIRPEFRRVHVTANLHAGERLIGFMCVGTSHARKFGEEDARLLEALAGLAALAIESAQLRERVQHLAVLQERDRIGCDLHDSIIQSLYGISLGLEHAQHLIDGQPAQAVATLERSMAGITSVLQDIRSYVAGLHPQTGGESLVDALDSVVSQMRVNTLLPVELHAPAVLPTFTTDERLHVQLLVREALANALRHAAAASVTVTAATEDGHLRITVADDGHGFDPVVVANGPGLGMRTMAERARRLGGTFEVHSASGQGTTVNVCLPTPAARRSVQ